MIQTLSEVSLEQEGNRVDLEKNSRKSLSGILVDYLFILILIGAQVYVALVYKTPHHQCIPGPDSRNNSTEGVCSTAINPLIGYKTKKETISDLENYSISAAIWTFILLFSIILFSCKRHYHSFNSRSLFKTFEVLVREFCFALFSTQVSVNIMKLAIGKPRPNFVELKPDNPEAWLSFPSGHASFTFCTNFLLTIHLAKSALYVQNKRKRVNTTTWGNVHLLFLCALWDSIKDFTILIILLVLSPTIVATYISCTRITDYWHDYSDVIGGAIIGMGLSGIAHKFFEAEFDLKLATN